MYYVYMLRCSDNSIYTGITTDIERRFSEHMGSLKGAKYTKSRKPVKIETAFSVASKSDALKIEIQIKKLTKSNKEKLINSELDFSSILDLEIKRISV